jgi:hypothetical protein
MRSVVRKKLQDPNSKYWSDEKLLTWANEFLSVISQKSEANIKKKYLALVSGQRSYALDDDSYEIRGVRVNAEKTFGSSAFDLSDLDVSFLTTTGTPQWYYLEGVNSIAFYPIPSWTAALTTFTSELGIWGRNGHY